MSVSIGDEVFVVTLRMDTGVAEAGGHAAVCWRCQGSLPAGEVVFAHGSKEWRVLQGQLET